MCGENEKKKEIKKKLVKKIFKMEEYMKKKINRIKQIKKKT